MTTSALYRDIVTAIEEAAREAAGSDAAYETLIREQSKKPRTRWYHLRVPTVDAIIRSFRQRFKSLSSEKRLGLAKRLYRSRYLEQIWVGLVLQRMSLDGLPLERFDYLDEIMDPCCNWSVCDGFSLYVLQPLVECHYQSMVALLRRWNKSPNMWKRRASVVTLTRKAGESGRHTDLVLELCENLVGDPEDLVQKGVGWALKDNLRGNHRKVLSYIKELRRRGVTSTITLYAIRDLRGTEREAMLQVKPARRNRPVGKKLSVSTPG